jgi:hypothetical protein
MFLIDKLYNAIEKGNNKEKAIAISNVLNEHYKNKTKNDPDAANAVLKQMSKTWIIFAQKVNAKRKHWNDLKVNENLFENNFRK